MIVCSVNNPPRAAAFSLSVMRPGNLPLNLHYPPVSQKPNTYNQLEAAPSLSKRRAGRASVECGGH